MRHLIVRRPVDPSVDRMAIKADMDAWLMERNIGHISGRIIVNDEYRYFVDQPMTDLEVVEFTLVFS